MVLHQQDKGQVLCHVLGFKILPFGQSLGSNYDRSAVQACRGQVIGSGWQPEGAGMSL